MLGFFELMFKILAYLLFRIRTGTRLSLQEKKQLLEGILHVGNEFLLECKNGSMGTSRMEISSRDNLCLPEIPIGEN